MIQGNFESGDVKAWFLRDWALTIMGEAYDVIVVGAGSVKDDYRQLSHDRVENDNLFKTTFGGNRQ